MRQKRQKRLSKELKGKSPEIKFSTTYQIVEKLNTIAKISEKSRSQVVNEFFIEAEPMLDVIIEQYKKIAEMKEKEKEVFSKSLEAKKEHLDDIANELQQPTFWDAK